MSVGFQIAFANNTPHEVTLGAAIGSAGDWDAADSTRPDMGIKNLTVAPFSTSLPIHLERHDQRATAPFTVTATFADNSHEVFELDGCDATEKKNDREVPVDSGSSGLTSVLQVTDDAQVSNWNLMTIYFTPYVPTTDWMGKLAGDPTLLHITIPGTHDTATYLGYGGPSAQCQTMDIAAQLAAGIRFMDLRLVVNGQDLSTYHASVNQWVSFKDVVLPAIVKFLKNHKDECVVICVNHAKDGAPSYDALLHEILINGVPPNTLYDHNDANTFSLKVKQLRGCVVLARRDSERTFGIDMTRWADNTPNQTFDAAAGMKVTLQDNYEWTDLAGAWDNKWNVVSPFLELARRTPPGYSIEASKTWFINFISAGGIVVPWDFATGALGNVGMNYRLARYLMKYSSRDGRLGTVVMDFPEQPGKGLLLTRLLLGTNTYA